MALNQINNCVEETSQVIDEFHWDVVSIEKLWDLFDETKSIRGYDVGKQFVFKK